MTRSARGTIEQPGTNVAQKCGLNRAILKQGWAQLGELLAYKTVRVGGTLVKAPAAYTSQTCAKCGAIDAASRRSQVMFLCVACGHAAHADVNAARNILAAGLAVTAREALGAVSRATNREPLTGLSHAA